MRPCALLLCPLLARAANEVSLIQSSATGDEWAPQPPLSWGADSPSPTDISVDSRQLHQTIMGFGTAMTDSSAYNAMVFMNASIRAEFFEALWGKGGLQYSIGRVTLNSADYSFQSFNYDNVTDDFALAHFDHSLAYDAQRVQPMIRGAQAVAVHPLKLFASPWSPPGWMKTNDDMIDSYLPCLKNDTAAGDSYAATWAAYIVAWLRSYEAAGLPMWGLTPQNEPMAEQKRFESCAYTPTTMADFIKHHLGPAVRSAFPDLKIMAYDHNKQAALSWMQSLYGDAQAASFIDGTAIHWYDYESGLFLDKIASIAALDETKFILGTEACVLEALVYGWNIGELYAVDIIGDINFGMVGWTQWNAALLIGDKYPFWRGGPNHDNTSSFGDPLLFSYDADGTQGLVRQSSYWIIGHLSRFAAPGSHRIGCSGAGVAATASEYDAVRAAALGQHKGAPLPLLATAFLSADGAMVSVVVVNPSDRSVAFNLRDVSGARAVSTTIPAHAVQTYTYGVHV